MRPSRRAVMSDKRTSNQFTIRSQIFEILAYVAHALLCWITTWVIIGNRADESYSLIALSVCLVSSVGPVVWQFGVSNAAPSDLSILLIVGFRFSLLLGALAISTATKWQHHNSFCNGLLGYYFPFLILQSAFLIRQQSNSIPPQS